MSEERADETMVDHAAPEGETTAEPAAPTDDGTDAPTGGDAPTDPGAVADEIAALRAEQSRLTDRHLRLAAEFENYRRRTEQDLNGAWGRAQADFLGKLVDALDDLQRVGTWEASTTTVEALIEGVDLVERKVKQALAAAGVEVLEPTGEAFDPSLMEAVMRVAADDEAQDDIVQDVFQKGYRLKGHLVRPARVSVLKHD
ncbi:MAG: nucleotide exchange factor GrpE [Gemmatimonadota bacterium]